MFLLVLIELVFVNNFVGGKSWPLFLFCSILLAHYCLISSKTNECINIVTSSNTSDQAEQKQVQGVDSTTPSVQWT